MKHNPFLAAIIEQRGNDDLTELPESTLAMLAVAHELYVSNAPDVEIASWAMQEGEEVELTTLTKRPSALADDSGAERIAAAARRWVKAHGARNTPGGGPAYHLATSELAEAVRQEDDQ